MYWPNVLFRAEVCHKLLSCVLCYCRACVAIGITTTSTRADCTLPSSPNGYCPAQAQAVHEMSDIYLAFKRVVCLSFV